MTNSNSHLDTEYTIFLGSTARVAQLVVPHWSNHGAVGGNLLEIARAKGRDGILRWNMTTAPPRLHFARPPVIVCFAGITPRSGAELAGNTTLALAAQNAAQAWGARHVFHLSSAGVYGDPGSEPVAELENPSPRGAYGQAKLAMERALADTATPHTILRLANVAGAGQPFDMAAQADTLRLDRFANGQGPSRSYIGPRSLAQVLTRLSALAHDGTPLPGVLNIAAPRPAAMADILLALGRRWQWVDAKPNAIQTVHLDTNRLAQFCVLPPDSGSAQNLVAELKDIAPK